MTEYEALRREIEARIWRETIFKAARCVISDSAAELNNALAENDEHIKLIGSYLLSKGDEWEKAYAKRK